MSDFHYGHTLKDLRLASPRGWSQVRLHQKITAAFEYPIKLQTIKMAERRAEPPSEKTRVQLEEVLPGLQEIFSLAGQKSMKAMKK